MSIRSMTRTVVAGAATLALAGGIGLAAPAIASADEGTAPPAMTVEQGDFDGDNVQVTVDDVNDPNSICVPLLVSGDTALQALVDYSTGDMGALVDDLANGDVKVGDPAYKGKIDWWVTTVEKEKTPVSTTWNVDEGVYLVVGVCKGDLSLSDFGALWDAVQGNYGALLDPETTAFTMQPLIVPDGIGSLAPAMDFGSLLLETPGALSALSSDGLLDGLLD